VCERVDLDGERDLRELAAEQRDGVAAHQQPQVAAALEQRPVDGDRAQRAAR
jgi:hypothetical protein